MDFPLRKSSRSHRAKKMVTGRQLRAHVFSSRLSSSRKRQSVPSAMIFCGLDLIMPVSCMRSA